MRASLVPPQFASLLVIWSGAVRAQTMDPAIDRLVDPSTQSCRTAGAIASNYSSTAYRSCLPDNVAFHRLAAQYAFAFAPTAMHSARTTGVGGWHLAMEAAYTSVDSGSAYWKSGTRGAASLAQGNAVNENPASILQLYSLKLRKGFGYGFEVIGQSGFMPQTSLWNVGADIRLSLLEGFRTGILGYVPDIAAGGGVRTISGTSQFQLTIASFDAQISKPIRVVEGLVVTPWLGYQQIYAFVDSNVIDFTPRTNQERLCNPTGQASPGQLHVDSAGEYTGKVMCASSGSSADYNNNRAFESVTLARQRLLLGASVRHEFLMFGLQFITDLARPADFQSNATKKAELSGMPRQWTIVLDAGFVL